VTTIQTGHLLKQRGWGRALRLPDSVAYPLALALCLRLTLSAIAAWTLSLRPVRETAIVRAQYLGMVPLHDWLLAPWQRFDTLWYLRLAAHGYDGRDGSTVYFPLYSLLIRGVAPLLGGNLMLAALAVSNVCFALLLLLLYRLVAGRHGHDVARRAVLLLCVFPTASFLLGAYTESLFLALVVGLFLAATRGRTALAGVLGLLAALTRLQGVVLALPLLWMAWVSWRQGSRSPRPWVAALLPPLGTGLFTLYTRAVLHAGPVTSVYAGQVHQQLGPPWVTLGRYWTALTPHWPRLFSYPTGNWVDALNIVLALAVLGLVLPARRIVGTELWLYALVTWVVTLCIHQSTDRYMLTVFPAFIVLSVYASGRRAGQLALVIGAPTMVFIASQFVLWSFVG